MGIRVSDFLVDSNFCFVDIDFTKNMEDDLDRIAKKEIGKLDILDHFWNRLKSDLDNANVKKNESSKTEYKCPECSGFLLKKFSKFGAFYCCENRTNKENKCEYKCQIGDNGEPYKKEVVVLEESEFVCPNCEEPLVKRTSKKGWEYLACRNWKDKKCEGFFDKENGDKIEFKKKTFKKWKKK
jgi:DNA topoisomerase-1